MTTMESFFATGKNDSFFKIWFTRIIVTTIIAIAWHVISFFIQQSQKKKESQEQERINNDNQVNDSRVAVASDRNRIYREFQKKEEEKEEVKEERGKEAKETVTVLNNEKKDSPSKKQVANGVGKKLNEKEHPEKPNQAQTSATRAKTEIRNPARSIVPGQRPKHPLEAFYNWYDVETSLFREYTIGTIKTTATNVTPVPSYAPRSRSGQLDVALEVTNQTNRPLEVFWVDHLGRETKKGIIRHGQTFYQTTWIEHPWVFYFPAGTSSSSASTNPTTERELAVHFCPFRIMPTTKQIPTIKDAQQGITEDKPIGLYRFTIYPADSSLFKSYYSYNYSCFVDDKVMPHPAHVWFKNWHEAMEWCFQHATRLVQGEPEPLALKNLLMKYLVKILQNPDDYKRRHIRLRNPNFAALWNSPARGLLLAVGFVEIQGYADYGVENKTLSREEIQNISMLLYRLENWKPDIVDIQPTGAFDGFGRAGFGRVGF